ncbi:MAG TPA: hypothetical protein VFG69_04315, partial [Nannocystaceae bacterium]|nr:hypothetical protein [Nannocystaceae bacterium]
MSTEAIVCPTCGAADSSRPDAQGLHTCVYCGVRYRLTGGVPTRLVAGAPAPAVATSRGVVVGATIAAIVLVVAGIAGAAYFALLRSDAKAPTAKAVELPTSSPQPTTPGGAASPSATVSVEAPGPTTATFELEHKRPGAG